MTVTPFQRWLARLLLLPLASLGLPPVALAGEPESRPAYGRFGTPPSALAAKPAPISAGQAAPASVSPATAAASTAAADTPDLHHAASRALRSDASAADHRAALAVARRLANTEATRVADFERIERHLAALNLPAEILARHRQAVGDHARRLQTVRGAADDLDDALTRAIGARVELRKMSPSPMPAPSDHRNLFSRTGLRYGSSRILCYEVPHLFEL